MVSPIKCPFCGSSSIFRYQRDADYGGGSYYTTVNPISCYEKIPEADYRPDVDLYHCGECDHFFEANMPAAAPGEPYVLVSHLKDRLNNVKEVRDFKMTEYRQMTISAKGRVEKATMKEMATRMPDVFVEIEKRYRKLLELDAQVDVLDYIIQKDAIGSNPCAAESSDAKCAIESPSVTTSGSGQ